jgi:hypothetical protein
LVRGAYGSTIAEHAKNSKFARMDNTIFKLPYTADKIGKVIYIKLASFNIYGGASQTLANLTPIMYSIGARIPADVTGLNISFNSGMANLTWNQPTDPDITSGSIVVAYTPLIAGVTRSSGNIMGRYAGTSTGAVFPAQDGTYLVWAEDIYSNSSANPALIISSAPSLLSLNEVVTLTENTAWAGTKTNCTNEADILQTTGSALFDSMTGNIDSIDSKIDVWGGVAATAQYLFANSADLGAVFTCLLSSDIRAYTMAVSDMIDIRMSNIDDWSNFDSIATASDQASWMLMISTSQSGAVWSDWAPFAPGEYKAGAFKFRIDFNSKNLDYGVSVTAASVTIDMADRLQSGSLATSAGGSHITFPDAFYSSSAHLAFTILNAATGDYPVPTNISATGFDVVIKNAAGVGVARNINWFAKAY